MSNVLATREEKEKMLERLEALQIFPEANHIDYRAQIRLAGFVPLHCTEVTYLLESSNLNDLKQTNRRSTLDS